MKEAHRLEIVSPTMNLHDTRVLLDGEELRGVTKIEFCVDANEPNVTTARITLILDRFAFDGTVYERAFDQRKPA